MALQASKLHEGTIWRTQIPNDARGWRNMLRHWTRLNSSRGINHVPYFRRTRKYLPVWVQISQVIHAAPRVGGTFVDSALDSVAKSTGARLCDDWANV